MMLDLILRGERVMLRPLRDSDAEDIYRNANDNDIAKWLLEMPHPYKIEDANWFINHAKEKLEKQESYIFGIELKGHVVGIISLENVSQRHRKAELGYWLGKNYWGQKIMSEAAELVIDFGFNRLELNRIWACVFHGNLGSRRLLEKIGMKYEGTMREAVERFGQMKTEDVFGILKTDYEARSIKK